MKDRVFLLLMIAYGVGLCIISFLCFKLVGMFFLDVMNVQSIGVKIAFILGGTILAVFVAGLLIGLFLIFLLLIRKDHNDHFDDEM